jgi:hypothetical protein
MEFEEYKRKSIKDFQESIRLFSHEGKKELEIWVSNKFLNTLNLAYTENEIIQQRPQDEPPDILFRDARFEVMELYDEERQRHKEYKDRLNKIKVATSYDNIPLPETWDINFVSLQELLTTVEERLHEKKGLYSRDAKAMLDVLIYVNLQKIKIRDKDYAFTLNANSKLRQWRSVSLVFNPDIVCVAHASVCAPKFIRSTTGKVIRK